MQTKKKKTMGKKTFSSKKVRGVGSSLSKNNFKKSIVSKKEKNLIKSQASKKNSMTYIAQEIKKEQIKSQRKPLIKNLDLNKKSRSIDNFKKEKRSVEEKNFTYTGIEGLDELFDRGIPKGNSILIAGGAGSGKTILCLQTLINQSLKGKKCLYMSFEEPEDKLIIHMEDFGWPAKEMVKKKRLHIARMNPFDITRNVEALLAKQKGELLIEVNPIITPKNFPNPDFIVIDSLTAIGSAFAGREESYRIYIEQLFRFLEKIGSTSFLITETEQIPKIFSQTGVEEFLADGVIVLYSLKHENVRENAIEVLKLRGAGHQKNIVAMQITGEGIVVYPEQEIFAETQ